MGRRSARETAKATQRSKPQPRKRVAQVRPWDGNDVAWVAVALLIFAVLTILTLSHRFTALMPDEGIIGVRVVLLIVFYLGLLMILAYRAHCRNLSFAEAYRLRKLSPDELEKQQFPLWKRSNKKEGEEGVQPHSEADAKQFLPAWKSVLLVIFLFFVVRSIATVYTYVTRELGWITPPSESLTNLFSPTLLGLAAAVVSIVLLAPFIEELVFRVIMFDTFAQKMSIAVAVILQGLIFSLYHLSLWAALPNFLLALACVYLVQKCRTVLPAIFLHALNNAAVVAAAFYIAMV